MQSPLRSLCLASFRMSSSHLLKAYSIPSSPYYVDPHLHVDMLVPFLDKLVLFGIVLHTLPLE